VVSEKHTPHVKLTIQVDRQLYSAQSEFQRIDVFESQEFGRIWSWTVPDADREGRVHLPRDAGPRAAGVNPEIRRVLVIGAGDGGVVRELTRYPSIESIDWSRSTNGDRG
jgi:spermidine synthase